jgi:di/tricarboxylate transporter
MTPQITLLLAILALSLILFWFEWVPADVVALGVMPALVFTGLLSASDAFAGFGSDIVMMLFGLLVPARVSWISPGARYCAGPARILTGCSSS